MAGRLVPAPPTASSHVLPPALRATDPALPNVYHLVLDAFQPDHFDQVWPKDATLEGFVYYPEAQSLFPATAPSMATVFTSRRQVQGPLFIQNALASADSLPQRLRAAGYRNVGYLPPGVYPEGSPGFDGVVWHTVTLPAANAAAIHRWMFRWLWVAVTMPAGLVDRFGGEGAFGLSAEDMRSLRNQRGSTPTQPVTTLLSFERYLEHEAALPARGRYTLVHLLVPHSPFVLAADCTFGDLRNHTDVLTQSRCAALVLRRFLDRLDRLGRLRDSTVLVQSDHGDWKGGTLTASQPALFLIKPGQASGALVRASGPASLLDVTPTLLGSLCLGDRANYEGRRLLATVCPLPPPSGGETSRTDGRRTAITRRSRRSWRTRRSSSRAGDRRAGSRPWRPTGRRCTRERLLRSPGRPSRCKCSIPARSPSPSDRSRTR